MRSTFPARCRALASLAVFFAATPAAADVLTYTFNIPLQSTSWNATAPIPRFNPGQGDLQAVELLLETHIEGTARFENRSPSPATVTTQFSANVRLRRPDLSTDILTAIPSFQFSDPVAAFDGVIDFGGASGRTHDNVTADNASSFVPVVPLSAVDHALFVGSGSILFPVSASGTSAATGSGNLIVNFQQKASVRVSITYTFEPPFFPDCNDNGIADSLDVANHSSTDCNANHLPDECEVIGNDCNDNSIPDDCDFLGGVLTDSDGDGTPDQCTCNTVERMRGGSLLIFPEFDNRQGATTILTVTNTRCGHHTDPVTVEFVYIDKSNCLESNRTHTLTPCDTITLLTDADMGTNGNGYVYAFARTLRGQAINYNWLIGSEIVLDTFTNLDYSFNPFVYRAIPVPEGALTDLDSDSIRDLNGREYEESPDVILVPRFLGQGNTTGSQLILIALSGGKAFTTTVGIQIFNDNEELLGAQYTFSCWVKPTLLEINGAFRNSVLLDTNNNPNEIEGVPGREAGWMRIDGFQAVSSQAIIIDPAILAVLIERSSTRFAASDLPFERCSQKNGDLLPTSPLGDTSP